MPRAPTRISARLPIASFSRSTTSRSAKLVSVDLNGGNRRDHAVGDLITDYQVSPDGSALAFRENYNVYVVPFFAGARRWTSPRAQCAAVDHPRDPRRRQFYHWTRGGQMLAWSMGPTLYTAATSSLLRTAPGGEAYSAPRSGVPLGISVTADRPQGQVALVGARIVTMAGDDGGVIEDGSILIDGNRIRAVGRRGAVAIPAGAQQVDVAGKTIIPGLIDGHAHGAQGENDLIPQQNWSAMSHLALGVTTVHDPSSTASEIFAAAEMQRAGLILAPRTFSSGEIVYGARAPGRYAQIDSYEDALNHIRRLETQGAHSIKNYNQPRRNQRQQVAAAARAENIIVVPEGGSLFQMDISLIQDGNTTVEHNLPQLRLYEDVVSLWSQTQVGNNPTLVVTYGGLAGDPYWSQATQVWNHPLLSRHTPPNELAGRVRAVTAPPEQFVDQYEAREAHRSMRRACRSRSAATASSPALPNIGNCGAMSAAARRRSRPCAMAPSIRPGSTALPTSARSSRANWQTSSSSTPIRSRTSATADHISRVMLNGRLYDAATLNEVVTGNRQRQPYFWEDGQGTARAAKRWRARSINPPRYGEG